MSDTQPWDGDMQLIRQTLRDGRPTPTQKRTDYIDSLVALDRLRRKFEQMQADCHHEHERALAAEGEIDKVRRHLDFAEGVLEDNELLSTYEELVEQDMAEARGQAMEP